MSRRETVTQRVHRRRGEAALRSYQKAGRGRVVGSLPPRENQSVPARGHELGCWVQGLLVAAPILCDVALWYAAGNGYPEVAGLALIGAPIAFMISFGMASAG